jgi:hypothetical protein
MRQEHIADQTPTKSNQIVWPNKPDRRTIVQRMSQIYYGQGIYGMVHQMVILIVSVRHPPRPRIYGPLRPAVSNTNSPPTHHRSLYPTLLLYSSTRTRRSVRQQQSSPLLGHGQCRHLYPHCTCSLRACSMLGFIRSSRSYLHSIGVLRAHAV